MAGVTINGAGSTLPDGSNVNVARQVASMISSISSQLSVSTNPIGTAPTLQPGQIGELIVSTTTAAFINANATSAYQYFVVSDAPLPNTAPVTINGGGALGQQVVLGVRPVTFNTGGGSGTIVGGDSNKSINIGNGTNFSIYTGAGDDTISLVSSAAAGRNIVEAGLAVTKNTVNLGAASTLVRSTGNDAVSVGAGAATIQVVGNVQDTVSGGNGALVFVEGNGASQVNYVPNAQNVPTAVLASGSATVVGGQGSGGLYRGGLSGANLLVGGSGSANLQGAGAGDVLIATGSNGTQILQAGAGNETLLGSLSTSNNVFSAGSGRDLIIAGSGDDRINAGTGSATITGGGGADLFVFDPRFSAGAQVVITDFTPGPDHVVLQAYAAPNAPANLVAAQQHISSTATRVTLSDGTTITFQGITSVNASFFA